MVEVLSALVIFSVAVIAIVQGMGTAISLQSGLVSRQRAAMLAQNVMEEIQYTGDTEKGSKNGEFNGNDATFKWESQVEETDVTGLMKVTVIVSWPEGGSTRDFRLVTLMSQQATTQQSGTQQGQQTTQR